MNKDAIENEPTKKRKEEEKEEDDDNETEYERKRRYQIAMQRWAILKQVLDSLGSFMINITWY